ncbi:MAG: hypothetical protein K2X69_11610, partial [Silvanigrellaceae bacterium]|nr:hypothetical protein [Silvanigrellaceae bacterium]
PINLIIISIIINYETRVKKNISHSNSQKNMSFNGMNMTRHEIYQNLRNLSENLAQLEPHSPVPLIIMRSLKWEKKSFLEIVFEVLKISSDKQSIMSLFLDNESENNLEEKVPLNHFNENAANFHNSLEEEDDF